MKKITTKSLLISMILFMVTGLSAQSVLTVSLSILRNGAKVENNIIGAGAGKMTPTYAFLSHIIELRHQIDVSPIRFKVIETLGHTSQITCQNTSMPFWGEKLIWKNGKFN